MPEASGRRGLGPECLGNYLLLERVAMGGMAEVYVAQRREADGRPALPVCVKRMLPHLAEDEQFITMFLDEARIASALDHPNLVRLLELGQEEDQYFIAMELVPGEPLSRVLAAALGGRDGEGRGKGRPPSSHGHLRAIGTPDVARGLSPALTAYIVAQAAAALHHAHQLVDARGRPMRIVHRDISPDNIMLSFGGAVKVIDFGVARAQGRLTQTQHGVAKGKFAYMSPEQARGTPIDHRSDVFSLGVVLWETLSGRRLFQRDSDRETIQAILNDPVPPLSTYGAVPVEFDHIVERALNKDPIARFPTAEHMRVALEKVLGAMTIEEAPATHAQKLGRLVRELMDARFIWWKTVVREAANRNPSVPVPAELLADGPATRGSATEPFIDPGESTANLRAPQRHAPASLAPEAREEAPGEDAGWRPRPWMIALAGFGAALLGSALWLQGRNPVAARTGAAGASEVRRDRGAGPRGRTPAPTIVPLPRAATSHPAKASGKALSGKPAPSAPPSSARAADAGAPAGVQPASPELARAAPAAPAALVAPEARDPVVPPSGAEGPRRFRNPF